MACLRLVSEQSNTNRFKVAQRNTLNIISLKKEKEETGECQGAEGKVL